MSVSRAGMPDGCDMPIGAGTGTQSGMCAGGLALLRVEADPTLLSTSWSRILAHSQRKTKVGRGRVLQLNKGDNRRQTRQRDTILACEVAGSARGHTPACL